MVKKNQNSNFQTYKPVLILVLTVALSTVVYFSDQVSYMLRTSVLGFPEHSPFDGTSYPVKQAPDWVHLSATDRTLTFSELSPDLIENIPYYDPAVLVQSTDGLSWGNAEHNKVRNAKITYSVPYMGNYQFDGREDAGSHAAVDIKVPKGTPVYSIANGTVIKASTQSSGFGHHIVVRHNNFPSSTDPNKLVVLYSSYSHMSDVLVSSGQILTKGEQIGLSGDTGTATTPHVHFQIDTDEAPWHPFWPFDWKDQQAAGLSFFEAINAGLGREKALLTTINPLVYVQSYLGGYANFTASTPVTTTPAASSDTTSSSVVATAGDVVVETVSEEVVVEEPVAEEVVAVVDPVEDEVAPEVVAPSLVMELAVEQSYNELLEAKFMISLRDSDGNMFADGLAEDAVIKSFKGNFEVEKSSVTGDEFDSSASYFGSMKNLNTGKDKIIVTHMGVDYYSDWFDITGNTKAGEFSDVSSTNPNSAAIYYLVDKGVVNGYPDNTFRPNNTVSRVEALKFIFEGIKEALKEGNLPFEDVSETEWYSKYLYTAYSKGVVAGYADGRFKPTQTVNKAEFYKILFNGMGVDVNPNIVADPFDDVAIDAWFAPYVDYAKQLGIVDTNINNFQPSKGMTRGEVADSIYRLMEVMK